MWCGTNLCSKILILSMIVHVLQLHFICLQRNLIMKKGTEGEARKTKGSKLRISPTAVRPLLQLACLVRVYLILTVARLLPRGGPSRTIERRARPW